MLRIYRTADKKVVETTLADGTIITYNYMVVNYEFGKFILGRCYTCHMEEVCKDSSAFVRNDDTYSNTLSNNDHPWYIRA